MQRRFLAPLAKRTMTVAHRTNKLVRTTSPKYARMLTSLERSKLKQWPNSTVICEGDYRAEAFLEKHIGGPLYENQDKLQRLPIPSLQETLDRFLPTALPLAETQEEEQSLLRAANGFVQQAQASQESLQQKQQEYHDSSWLQHWWNTLGYLQVRDTVVVNVSYFFHFSNDPTLEGRKNVERGAAMLYAAAKYRQLVCSGTLPADVVGRAKTPLCSTAYKYMFNACRIPKPHQDEYHLHDPSLCKDVIVARKGLFFSMPWVDDAHHPLPLSDLEDGLQQVIQKAAKLEGSVPDLGVLTSNNRDDWANARAALVKKSPALEQALHKLERGALLLCLDDESPTSREHMGELLLHGGGTERSGTNRWFDKSIQLICTNNGKSGLQGEHSMMDGMPVVGLADCITKMDHAKALEESPSGRGGMQVEHIFEGVFDDPDVRATAEMLIEEAKYNYTTLVNNHELQSQSFQGYGSNYIKSVGFSPDAYVQMAMQIATARLFGKQAGTYEATQVRPFLHGRTETTRSVSAESAALCEAMGEYPNFKDAARKKELLQAAVDAHVKYIRNAAQAQGVDRHFLGLALAAGGNKIDLLQDPVFARSKKWRVSTSHLTHPKFENWGYGEVVPDGVGLSYAILPDSVVFNITALKENNYSNRLSFLLEEALLELRSVVQDQEGPRSRL